MARKPDLFEQMVEKLFERWGMQTTEHHQEVNDILLMLRRYHAQVRRLVMERSAEYMKEANNKIWTTQTQASYASKAWAFKDFAEELDRLKKGGK